MTTKDADRRRILPALLATALAGAAALVGPVPVAAAAAQADPVAVLSGMSLQQQVGEVFMVGGPATGVGPDTVAAIRDRHVGSVILTGRSFQGVPATAGTTAGLQTLATGSATAGVGLLIATDQEGGEVQVLQGPGFSGIPSALVQGQSDPATLRQDAASWGGQLRAAGVNVDLAPVLDTVPSAAAAPGNPPIGAYDREYGFTPDTVAAHGTAFAQGMADAGVLATGKHFPGLGRVTANTDTTAGVTDTVTTRDDPYVQPFRSAVTAGLPMLMISSAYYSRIDPQNPAVFSGTVINGMVRGDLGFQGVVVSDDLANARQVAAWSPGSRAVQFLDAGGDLVLTVNPTLLPAMYDAVLARAECDSGFRARVAQAALRVLRAKQAVGLLPSVPPPPAGTWSLYKTAYADTIYELVDNVTPTPLTFQRWRDVYSFQAPCATPTDYVKYSWSPAVYAVTFWPGGQNAWQWDRLSLAQWSRAGYPTPRIAGWIAGSSYYQWQTSPEIFVSGADGSLHKLSYAEWAASGFRPFAVRTDQGYQKLTWSPEIGAMTDIAGGHGSRISFAQWAAAAFPTPQGVPRFPGDQFTRTATNPVIYYSGPLMSRAISYPEWAAAGFPPPRITG